MIPKLLSVDELANALNISRAAAYNMVSRKEIKSLRVGGVIRIRESDLIELINCAQ